MVTKNKYYNFFPKNNWILNLYIDIIIYCILLEIDKYNIYDIGTH